MKTQENAFGPFLLILGQTRIFLGNPPLSLFSVFRFLLVCNISEKYNKQIPRKTGYRRTDGQAWTQRIFLYGGPKNMADLEEEILEIKQFRYQFKHRLKNSITEKKTLAVNIVSLQVLYNTWASINLTLL